MRGALLFAVALAAGCGERGGAGSGSGRPRGAVAETPGTPHRVGQGIAVGDVRVTVTHVKITGLSARTADGEFIYHGRPELVALIDIENTNPGRVADVGAQTGSATAVDDLSNSYRPVGLSDALRRPAYPDEQIRPGTSRRVRSGEKLTDLLIFESPVPAAGGVTLALDAAKYGGKGLIRVRSRRDEWSSESTPGK